MSKHSLEVLFESKTRLKILKFLFRNYDNRYTFSEIVNHTQEEPQNVRKEIAKMKDINLIHEEKKEKTIKA